MLSRFHTIPACHARRDGQTDRIAISISRVSSSMLTRDKNQVQTKTFAHPLFLKHTKQNAYIKFFKNKLQ